MKLLTQMLIELISAIFIKIQGHFAVYISNRFVFNSNQLSFEKSFGTLTDGMDYTKNYWSQLLKI